MMNPDINAIEAVKHGNRERFGELVERHKRMVYAIAWSYLGDVDLSEDAAQETFIKAFRYIQALRNPERFASWLARIARNVSATLLRRRVTELKRQKRWQAEQPSPPSHQTTDEDQSLAESLSQTLGELPLQHRECLILFYMEGKSIKEAAKILGLSETAMKTRLHRARRILRGQIEQQMERGLGSLRPRKDFAASVMLVLPIKPLGVAGVGGGVSVVGKAVTWLGNLLPLSIFPIWLMVSNATFAYLMLGWYGRMEVANIIDKPENQFRKALLRREVLTKSLGMICILICMPIMIAHIVTFFQILTLYCVWGVYKATRLLRVNRSLYTWGQVLSLYLFTAVFFLIFFFSAPMGLFFVCMLFLNILLYRTNRNAPRRHDYNLFLRQANGMLKNPQSNPPLTHKATESEQRAFARFLGEQWLVRDYSIKGSTLLLRLTPVRMTLLGTYVVSNAGCSVVIIQADGNCHAILSKRDAKEITNSLKRPIDAQALENGVRRSIQGAFALFQRGQNTEAWQLLSTLDDEAIFTTDFSRTRGYRLQHGIAIAACMMLIIMSSLTPGYWQMNWHWFQYWQPKPVSQGMAQKGIGEWIDSYSRSSSPELLDLWTKPIPPTLALIGERNIAGYKRIVSEALKMDFKDGEKGAIECRIVNGLSNPYLLYQAIATPILSTDELAALGFNSEGVRKTVTGLNDKLKYDLLHLPEGTYENYRTDYRRFKVIDIEKYALWLYILKSLNCLDLIDRQTIAHRIASLQLTSKFRLPEGYEPIDIKQAPGLFHTGRCGMCETWASLWALEMLGRLDLINREACIQGILKFYRGKGIFKAKDPWKSGAKIVGNEEDAFYAMESLARLKALDRISDFEKWKFHPLTQTMMVNKQPSPNRITAEALRSLAYQERLEGLQKKLAERKPPESRLVRTGNR